MVLPARAFLPHLALLAPLLGGLLFGCGERAPRDESALRRQLKEKGTLEVLKEAERARFTAPSDGHLTPSQVEMYLAVRRHARVIRSAALANLKESGGEARRESGGKATALGALQAVGDVGDVATAALRAAEELGHNPKEYRWVAERIEDARVTGATEGMKKRLAAGRLRILALLEERVAKTQDREARRELAEDIALLRGKTEALARPASEADRYNAALLERYAADLAALRREEIEFYADRMGFAPRPTGPKDGGSLGTQ